MTRLSGQSAPLDLACPGKDEPGSPFVAARRLSAGNAGRLRVNLRRSLQLHRRLALGIALAGAVLAVAWFVKLWPVYIAQSQVYIQPAPPRVMEQGGALRWPYDTGTYESYMQQQMASVTRQDVLANALHTLGPGPWQGSGESDQAATERLRKAIEATRVGATYQLSISARASNPEIAAQMANAVTASYIESAAREQKAGNAERMALLREELARVKAELASDRTEHEGQSKQPGVAAGGAALQRPSELAADIARLQARFAAVDGQLHNLMLEDRAPGAAFLTTAAVAPLHPAMLGSARNAVLLAFAVMLLGILAAVAAHKLDPRVYIAADVEQVLGMAPMAQLADFAEVSDGVAEEHLLRLSAAIEFARKQGMKSCIFTGAGPGAGVTTVATRVRDTLEAMGRTTVLVDAAGTPAARAHDSAEEAPATRRGSHPTSLLRQVAEETKEERLVLTDTAPLTVSAETETLARYVDCVVIVIESGVTTRGQLREVASILRRLDVAAVGFVLNCVGLETADPAFRRSVQATEQHLRSRCTVRQTVRSRSHAAEEAPDAGSYSNESNARQQAEAAAPDVAAERSASPSMAEAATAPPRPHSEARTPPERESTQPLAEPDSGAPWWLADLFAQPDASRSAVVPVKARDGVSQPVAVSPASERHAPPAQSRERASSSFDDLRPEAAQAEVRQPVAEATSYNPPSRLSSLKNLFFTTSLNHLNEARDAGAQDGKAMAQPEKEAGRAAVDRTFVPLPEPAPIAGTSQRQVFALPEFLPPKPVVQAGKERGRQTGSTDHRDRREAYDEMEILPSWRGQYKKKN